MFGCVDEDNFLSDRNCDDSKKVVRINIGQVDKQYNSVKYLQEYYENCCLIIGQRAAAVLFSLSSPPAYKLET